jgi:hypothetical protein
MAGFFAGGMQSIVGQLFDKIKISRHKTKDFSWDEVMTDAWIGMPAGILGGVLAGQGDKAVDAVEGMVKPTTRELRRKANEQFKVAKKQLQADAQEMTDNIINASKEFISEKEARQLYLQIWSKIRDGYKNKAIEIELRIVKRVSNDHAKKVTFYVETLTQIFYNFLDPFVGEEVEYKEEEKSK